MARRFSGLIAVASAIVLAAAASAVGNGGAPPRTTAFEVSLVGTMTGAFEARCASSRDFAGRAVIAPPLGLVRFSGRYMEGCIRFEELPPGVPPTSLRSLELVLELRNGQRLVLVEDVSWPTWIDASVPVEELVLSAEPSRTWTVDPARSSGGLNFTGAGTYAVDIGLGGPGSARVTVTLSGELTQAR